MEKDYINPFHGMELFPGFESGIRDNENGIHYLAIYYMLKHIAGKMTHKDIEIFKSIVNKLRTYDLNGQQINGLYDRGAGESRDLLDDELRDISHDNINAIGCFSEAFEKEGLEFHHHIAKYGQKKWWRFDNKQPENPRWKRIMHPRDIIMWSYTHGSFWAKFMIWEPMLECIWTCYKKYDVRPTLLTKIINLIKTGKWIKQGHQQVATSGKLLAFVRLYSIRDRWFGKLTWKICNKFINKNFKNGWKGVFNYYFKLQSHPINLLIEVIYNKNKELF